MIRKILIGMALGLVSIPGMATTVYVHNVPWTPNPAAFTTGIELCNWTYIASYGTGGALVYKYANNGSCAYHTMYVTNTGGSTATLTLINNVQPPQPVTLYNLIWYGYGNPGPYTGIYGCVWTHTITYGGSWGTQFNYISSGSCIYGRMQINYSAGATYAQGVLFAQ